MRVTIDHDRCTGHGRCYSLASALFTDDEFGHGSVIGDGELTTPDQVDLARRAATSCPERAIAVIE